MTAGDVHYEQRRALWPALDVTARQHDAGKPRVGLDLRETSHRAGWPAPLVWAGRPAEEKQLRNAPGGSVPARLWL